MEKTTTDTNEENGPPRERRLPKCSDWPHRPVYLEPGSQTHIPSVPADQPLPLGVPFAFESPLFKGNMLVRFRNIKSDDDALHQAYFAGRSRVMQTVVQGRFKKQVSWSDIYVGSFYQEPMAMVPPPFFLRLLNMLIPGSILDLASAKPKVVTRYAGTAQTISVHDPGAEPDITAVDLPENFPGNNASIASQRQGSAPFRSITDRKRKMANPTKATLYQSDPQKVYTLQIYDESLDYGTYNLKLPVYGNFNLAQAVGPQPMTLTAATLSGEIMYDFNVWHESVYRLKYPDAE